MRPLLRILPLLVPAFFLFSCKEEFEDLELQSPEEYSISLQPGKYITYRLDSLVFTQQGRAEETHSYQERHLVDSKISDNLNRPSYRIYKSIRDLAGVQPWRPAGSYFITPLDNSVEVIEDNLRTIKLISPIKEGTSWKGARFFSSEPYAAFYNFSNDDNIADWDFTIDSTNTTIVLNGKTINDVISLTAVNESLNVPILDSKAYASKTLLQEKFARGIGLVFQEYILWEYQPNLNGTPYKTGFGVKRTMLDHN
ncbi:MAG TPA: hypothetical protein VNA26_05635 [Chitinophagaceae bacterium]|nr:hypothetical protein [Chitinophagaceae bacterium]